MTKRWSLPLGEGPGRDTVKLGCVSTRLSTELTVHQSCSAGALDSQNSASAGSSRLRSRAKEARRGWVSESLALSLSAAVTSVSSAFLRWGLFSSPAVSRLRVAWLSYIVEQTSSEDSVWTVACEASGFRVRSSVGGNLVDPASSHMLVSKIKPCMSQYKLLYGETANGSLKQL